MNDESLLLKSLFYCIIIINYNSIFIFVNFQLYYFQLQS